MMSRQMSVLAVVIMLTVLSPLQSADAAACFSYDDAVTLEGHLVSREFPGPPNYESVENGDARETAYLLELLQPICVRRGEDKTEFDKDLDDVSVVHVLPSYEHPDTLQDQVGQTVKMTGRLWGAHTGHHRAPLLLDIKSE